MAEVYPVPFGTLMQIALGGQAGTVGGYEMDWNKSVWHYPSCRKQSKY
jgi:hypothetical protein